MLILSEHDPDHDLQGVMALKEAQGQSEDGRTWKNCPYAVIVTPGRELADQVSPDNRPDNPDVPHGLHNVHVLLLTQGHIPDW